MDLKLAGRIAIVTGGSKGIGAGIVRSLAREGVRVAICARQSDQMTQLVKELRTGGVDCSAFPVDVCDARAIEAVMANVAREYGGLDILVNNVGGAIRFGGFEDLADDDWLRAFELNVMSMVRFTRAALPHLRKSSLKRVINISSIGASRPGVYNPHYTITKAAVSNLAKVLANLLASEQILVNTVCPGPVASESWDENIRRIAERDSIGLDEARGNVEREETCKIPLGAIGTPAHIGDAVAFLASPLSSWTTGTSFHVDGGKLGVAP